MSGKYNVQEDSLQFIEQVPPAPSETLDGGIDVLKDINLAVIEDPKPNLVGALLSVKN